MEKKRVAIAGATGFIGHFLIDQLLRSSEFRLRALSRSPIESENQDIEFVQADLYSLLDCEKALENCDMAVYLVHSMLPSSRLAQGEFQDFDFILADNFVKAAEKKGVKKIVYVSGIIPDKDELSAHLASRLEVEETLNQNSVKVITLRCGLVVGKKGSSFQIVERLVERLRLMGLPQWTKNNLQIVYVKDLVKIVEKCLSKDKEGAFDTGAPQKIDYKYILQKVSQIKGTKNWFVEVPLVSPALSKLWVCLITGLSARLIYPLVDSLIHSMVVDPQKKLPEDLSVEFTSVDEALDRSVNTDSFPELPGKRQKKDEETSASLVQSVQRLPCPRDWSSKDVAKSYMRWLPKFLFPFLNIVKDGDCLEFKILGFKRPLLILEFSNERTFEGRDLFYIRGGSLSNDYPAARLEFRRGPKDDFVIAAIHNFRPSLPWLIYRLTQAKIHAFVIWSFGRWLKKQ